jgi:hypothetical protein
MDRTNEVRKLDLDDDYSRRTPLSSSEPGQPPPGRTSGPGSMPYWARALIGHANRLSPSPGFPEEDMMTVWERCEERCAVSGLEFSEVLVGDRPDGAATTSDRVTGLASKGDRIAP